MSDAGAMKASGVGEVLAVGFGTTVAMWAVGYVARLPVVLAPPSVVFFFLLLALVGGGYVAGSRGSRGARGGAYGGALTGLLNLLVLGSFLSSEGHENVLVPSAAFWLLGSIAFSSALARGCNRAAVVKCSWAKRSPRPISSSPATTSRC